MICSRGSTNPWLAGEQNVALLVSSHYSNCKCSDKFEQNWFQYSQGKGAALGALKRCWVRPVVCSDCRQVKEKEFVYSETFLEQRREKTPLRQDQKWHKKRIWATLNFIYWCPILTTTPYLPASYLPAVPWDLIRAGSIPELTQLRFQGLSFAQAASKNLEGP